MIRVAGAVLGFIAGAMLGRNNYFLGFITCIDPARGSTTDWRTRLNGAVNTDSGISPLVEMMV